MWTKDFSASWTNFRFATHRFIMKITVFSCREQLQVRNIVVSFVFVNVMDDIIADGNFTVIILPHSTMKGIIYCIMTTSIFAINHAVKLMVSIVNNFDDGRGNQIAFEDVNAVAFKIIFGEGAKFGDELGNTFKIFHVNHSLQICAGRDKIHKHGKPLRFRLYFRRDNLSTEAFRLQ